MIDMVERGEWVREREWKGDSSKRYDEELEVWGRQRNEEEGDEDKGYFVRADLG